MHAADTIRNPLVQKYVAKIFLFHNSFSDIKVIGDASLLVRSPRRWPTAMVEVSATFENCPIALSMDMSVILFMGYFVEFYSLFEIFSFVLPVAFGSIRLPFPMQIIFRRVAAYSFADESKPVVEGSSHPND